MKMEDNGIRIDNWDAPIFRTFPFQYALELFTNNQNVLVHPELWADPFENFLLKNGAVDEEGNPVDLSDVYKDFYGQCWTLKEESDALWRIYSPDKTGVCIATTIRKLFENFYKLNESDAYMKYFIGKVEYRNANEFTQLTNNTRLLDISYGANPKSIANTLLIKRESFDHEHEVRLLFNDFNNTGSTYNKNDLKRFNFNANDCVTKVLLDPRLEPIVFDAFKAGLVNAGCNKAIEKATLYDFPSTPIRLV